MKFSDMQQKINKVHVEDPVQIMQAAPNSLQKANIVLQLPTVTPSST